MIKRNVSATQDGVKIAFNGAIKKNTVLKMVENCSTGQCECMSDESKAKMTDMKVSGSDGDIALEIDGDLTTREIEAALARSKVINKDKA